MATNSEQSANHIAALDKLCRICGVDIAVSQPLQQTSSGATEADANSEVPVYLCSVIKSELESYYCIKLKPTDPKYTCRSCVLYMKAYSRKGWACSTFVKRLWQEECAGDSCDTCWISEHNEVAKACQYYKTKFLPADVPETNILPLNDTYKYTCGVCCQSLPDVSCKLPCGHLHCMSCMYVNIIKTTRSARCFKCSKCCRVYGSVEAIEECSFAGLTCQCQYCGYTNVRKLVYGHKCNLSNMQIIHCDFDCADPQSRQALAKCFCAVLMCRYDDGSCLLNEDITVMGDALYRNFIAKTTDKCKSTRSPQCPSPCSCVCLLPTYIQLNEYKMRWEMTCSQQMYKKRNLALELQCIMMQTSPPLVMITSNVCDGPCFGVVKKGHTFLTVVFAKIGGEYYYYTCETLLECLRFVKHQFDKLRCEIGIGVVVTRISVKNVTSFPLGACFKYISGKAMNNRNGLVIDALNLTTTEDTSSCSQYASGVSAYANLPIHVNGIVDVANSGLVLPNQDATLHPTPELGTQAVLHRSQVEELDAPPRKKKRGGESSQSKASSLPMVELVGSQEMLEEVIELSDSDEESGSEHHILYNDEESLNTNVKVEIFDPERCTFETQYVKIETADENDDDNHVSQVEIPRSNKEKDEINTTKFVSSEEKDIGAKSIQSQSTKKKEKSGSQAVRELLIQKLSSNLSRSKSTDSNSSATGQSSSSSDHVDAERNMLQKYLMQALAAPNQTEKDRSVKNHAISGDSGKKAVASNSVPAERTSGGRVNGKKVMSGGSDVRAKATVSSGEKSMSGDSSTGDEGTASGSETGTQGDKLSGGRRMSRSSLHTAKPRKQSTTICQAIDKMIQSVIVDSQRTHAEENKRRTPTFIEKAVKSLTADCQLALGNVSDAELPQQINEGPATTSGATSCQATEKIPPVFIVHNVPDTGNPNCAASKSSQSQPRKQQQLKKTTVKTELIEKETCIVDPYDFHLKLAMSKLPSHYAVIYLKQSHNIPHSVNRSVLTFFTWLSRAFMDRAIGRDELLYISYMSRMLLKYLNNQCMLMDLYNQKHVMVGLRRKTLHWGTILQFSCTSDSGEQSLAKVLRNDSDNLSKMGNYTIIVDGTMISYVEKRTEHGKMQFRYHSLKVQPSQGSVMIVLYSERQFQWCEFDKVCVAIRRDVLSFKANPQQCLVQSLNSIPLGHRPDMKIFYCVSFDEFLKEQSLNLAMCGIEYVSYKKRDTVTISAEPLLFDPLCDAEQYWLISVIAWMFLMKKAPSRLFSHYEFEHILGKIYSWQTHARKLQQDVIHSIGVEIKMIEIVQWVTSEFLQSSEALLAQDLNLLNDLLDTGCYILVIIGEKTIGSIAKRDDQFCFHVVKAVKSACHIEFKVGVTDNIVTFTEMLRKEMKEGHCFQTSWISLKQCVTLCRLHFRLISDEGPPPKGHTCSKRCSCIKYPTDGPLMKYLLTAAHEVYREESPFPFREESCELLGNPAKPTSSTDVLVISDDE